MCLASKQLQQFEQRVLQTGSSEGGLQLQREGQQPHSTQYRVHGAQELDSMVAQGLVKHGFKVLLHRVVDGPLQASRCLVSRTPCIYTRYTRVFWALAYQIQLGQRLAKDENSLVVQVVFLKTFICNHFTNVLCTSVNRHIFKKLYALFPYLSLRLYTSMLLGG